MNWLRAALIAGVLLTPTQAFAIRPFITDDARVVGKHCAQLETWVRHTGGRLEYWFVPAYGPIAPVELTIGFMQGMTTEHRPRHYAAAGPLLQSKILLRSDEIDLGPGVAVVFGSNLPFGFGGYRGPPGGFAYLAVTETLPKESVLIHANVGTVFTRVDGETIRSIVWGLGTQLHVLERGKLVVEVFSGDPYIGGGGGAVQTGMRFIISEHVQIDTTMGTGIWGSAPLATWMTAGLRLATGPLY